MTDVVKKCRRVQSQRFRVSQGFLSGQKFASKAVATSRQLWSGGGLALQSEENALLLPWVKGRLSWEDRGQQLPSQHNCPTVRQHLTNQVWCFTSDWSGLVLCALITATQAFPEHFRRVFILEMQAVSTITVVRQDHSKAVTHSTSTMICSVGQGRKGSRLQERGVDISSREASQQLVQNEHKPTLHNWPPPTIPLTNNNWSVPLADFTVKLLLFSFCSKE